MQNIKLFPSFKTLENSSESDMRFLKEIRKTARLSGASFINFSAYEYGQNETRSLHYVTYPIEWVTHYIQANYVEIDPLFHLDYRRVEAIDWMDIRKNSETKRFFADFNDHGLGNHGIILSCYLESGSYGVTHFCFQCIDSDWTRFRQDRIELLRELSVSLAEAYQAIFQVTSQETIQLTNRERQCLFWVARGKTDEEIGVLLTIGKWTVVSHLKSAKYKLGCTNRASAVAKALDLGMINLKSDRS